MAYFEDPRGAVFWSSSLEKYGPHANNGPLKIFENYCVWERREGVATSFYLSSRLILKKLFWNRKYYTFNYFVKNTIL
jgi:hypothetical protein